MREKDSGSFCYGICIPVLQECSFCLCNWGWLISLCRRGLWRGLVGRTGSDIRLEEGSAGSRSGAACVCCACLIGSVSCVSVVFECLSGRAAEEELRMMLGLSCLPLLSSTCLVGLDLLLRLLELSHHGLAIELRIIHCGFRFLSLRIPYRFI